VKFIFATTEVNKVPVTVLSRCQRFDLRRVPADTLAKHFAEIVAAEGAAAEPEALALIARAAEGSVRDGLSVLDQAIAHSAGTITADAIRDMLGLADRGAVRQLFGLALAGDAAGTLAAIGQQYDLGLDPEMLLRALLELVHAITRQRLAPTEDPALSVEERALLADWAQRLSFPVLHRLWQLLLKGLAEVQAAPVPLQAAEMALLRLIHASDLPDPADLLRRLSEGGSVAAPATAPATPVAPPATVMQASAPVSTPTPVIAPPPVAPARFDIPTSATPVPADFPALVALFRNNNEARLHHMLTDDLRLVSYAPPHLTLAAPPRAAREQLAMIAKRLTEWTATEWQVDFVDSGGASTLREAELAGVAARLDAARADPAVAALFNSFPEAEIIGFDPDERISHAQSR
jgi:DNA polymerase-3 subunit gamma/tau